MIKGNWSLSQELKQKERKQQSKIQQRQKHEFQMKKLSKIDPIKLYYKIENLYKKERKSKSDETYLSSLRDDWAFIEKNQLHLNKLKKLNSEIEAKEKLKLKEQNKLWGQKSIYFNPELNPFGKVPDENNLTMSIETTLKNLTIPLKETSKYVRDPLIKELNIQLPPGQPPKFYKLIQNTSKNKTSNIIEQDSKRRKLTHTS